MRNKNTKVDTCFAKEALINLFNKSINLLKISILSIPFERRITTHAVKLRIQLTALNAAKRPDDMSAPGWELHPLKGADLKGHWAISVNGNWRLTFRFEGEDAILVDYQDYH